MMDINKIYTRIELLQSTSSKNTYILFEIHNGETVMYYGIDGDRHPVFVLKSTFPLMRPQVQNTKKLVYNFNLNCDLLIDGILYNKTVHMFTCLSHQYEEQIAFIRLTESFSRQLTKDNPFGLNDLFSALVSLFAQERYTSDVELQGLFSELFVIRFFSEYSVNLLPYWQKQSKMNFDFMIPETKRLEVKSTTRVNRIHHFRHEQLLSQIYDIVVASIMLRRDESGTSLYQLIQDVRLIAANEYEVLLYIERLVKNKTEEELTSVKYDEIHARNTMRFYRAIDIPKFNEEQPDGVSRTEYDSDLSTAPYISLDDVIAWLGYNR